jgi:phenylacetate-CoA ligase
MEYDIHPDCMPDYLDPGELRALQLARLQATVQRCFDNVDLFRQRMNERGLTPGDIRTLDDVSKLPFTQKTDLRDTYPYGLFAVPMKEVVRLHASSGTTGKPIVVGYTKDDLDVWSSVVLRSFIAAGLHAGDVLQNAYGYGLFTGGLGAHGGAERLGAAVIPISGGNTDRQIMVMKDFGVTAICCTPSYFIHLIEKVNASGISFKDLDLKIGVFGAEP